MVRPLLAAFAMAATFVIPLFICRHCPEWAREGRFLTCSHLGIPKLYRYCAAPLSRFQQQLVYAGFWVIYGAGVVLLLLARSYALSACAAYNAVLWYCVMRRTLCRTCQHPSCPMKKGLTHVPT